MNATSRIMPIPDSIQPYAIETRSSKEQRSRPSPYAKMKTASAPLRRRKGTLSRVFYLSLFLRQNIPGLVAVCLLFVLFLAFSHRTPSHVDVLSGGSDMDRRAARASLAITSQHAYALSELMRRSNKAKPFLKRVVIVENGAEKKRPESKDQTRGMSVHAMQLAGLGAGIREKERGTIELTASDGITVNRALIQSSATSGAPVPRGLGIAIRPTATEPGAEERPRGAHAKDTSSGASGHVGRFAEYAPVFSFVLFSSYRLGPSSVGVLGFAARALRESRQLHGCLWKEKGGGHRVSGTLQAFFPGEHHDLRYEAVLLQCQLEESTAADYGGLLSLHVDEQELPAYEEQQQAPPETGRPALPLPSSPPRFQLAFCSPPLTGRLHVRRVHEWLQFHLHAGMERAVLYDAGGVDQRLAGMLEAYAEAGLVEVVDARRITAYEAWDHGRLLLINDCVQRHRFAAQWVFFSDLEEFFVADGGSTMQQVLRSHAGKPYVSFGSRWWSLERCSEEEPREDASGADGASTRLRGNESRGHDPPLLEAQKSVAAVTATAAQEMQQSSSAVVRRWPVERMQFRWPHVYCTNREAFPRTELCLDYHGFRRVAVDPRQTLAVQIHRSEVPRSGGADVDTDVARFNRFEGLLGAEVEGEGGDGTGAKGRGAGSRQSSARGLGKRGCTQVVRTQDLVDWWVRDDSVAVAAAEARRAQNLKFQEDWGAS